ncbi:uncharacterized protein N7515_008247 [Penicillium bovifimosum]|uniref:GST N-terminal domain-containing protein n=1 Tax=Penicillium bovifimosum TaxID=126998 RepID=A0A9W9KXB4_9EURO|nr:uncharacterized protein N7515_008247 [Penicillium bovifimosum]KAJ5124422.1 hypothetical protein N7515_008247 [Penicillium bovifimosum]
MAESNPIHFFDIVSTLPVHEKSWSPSTLKTRMVLNFKGIPYTQSWVSYPDIAPLLKAHGVAPGESKFMPYTLPAIAHEGLKSSTPDGVLMDSDPIAMYIDKLYPSPPLFPSGDASYALVVAVSKSLSVCREALVGLVIPNVPSHLDERGREYFNRTRAEWFGKPLSEVKAKDEEVERLWQILETEYMTFVKMLKGKEGKNGLFLEGERAGYADITIAAMLAFIQRFAKGTFEKLMALGDGELKRLYEACLPWLEGQGDEKEWPIPQ